MFPKVKFRVDYGFYNEFLNYMISSNIRLTSVTRTDYGFEAVCAADEYRKIARMARKFQCRTKITERSGIYFRTRKLIRRKGLVAGIILFFALCFLFSDIVWKIDINCADDDIKNKIVSQLMENNIYAGCFYSKDKFYDVEQQLQKANRSLSFVTLNFYRGILECNAYSGTDKLDLNEKVYSQDIICALGGVVTDTKVYSGFLKVKKGQSVLPGEVLVSTNEKDKFGDVYYMDTSAYIEGRCIKEYTVFVPYEKAAEVYTGKTKIEKEIYFPGGKWRGKKCDFTGWENYTSRTVVTYLSFIGFSVPATIKTTTYYQQEKIQLNSTLPDIIYASRTRAEHLIKRDTKLKKEISRKYDYRQTETGLYMTCTVEGYYDMT